MGIQIMIIEGSFKYNTIISHEYISYRSSSQKNERLMTMITLNAFNEFDKQIFVDYYKYSHLEAVFRYS